MVHEATALAAIDFWNGFLILRMGAAGDKPLDAAALQRLAAIVRAVSWVESKHGTATTNQGTRDTMQCGHPQDAWWRQVTSAGRPGQDRFITGPGGTNFWAGDLPEAAERAAGFPAAATISGLGNQALGHDDPAFNPTLSYHWGVPFLVHKINASAGAVTFKCGDLSRDRLIDGAVAYNGGGDPRYRDKIVEALALSGGLPAAPQARAAGARRLAAPSPARVLATVADVLARAGRLGMAARITAASIKLAASHVDGEWLAAPIAGASGEAAIVATLSAPFNAGRDEGGAEDRQPVVDAIAALLADMSEAPAPMSSVVEIPVELGVRDGAVSVALSAAAGATHVLVLSIERRTKRAGQSSRART